MILMLLGLLAGVAHGEPPNVQPADPSPAEIEAVRLQLAEALGDSISERHVTYSGGQSWHSSEYMHHSCYIELVFHPKKLPGDSVTLRFEHPNHSSWRLPFPQALPDCAGNPSLCDINITRDQALRIAESSGLKQDISAYSVRLTLLDRYRGGVPNGFYWEIVGEEVFEERGDRSSQEYLLIDAVMGAPTEVKVLSTTRCFR